MNKNIQVWKLLQHSLQKKVRAMLLYVLESKGSSPGRQGFFMAVTGDGEMEGSIGGGMMEYKLVEMSKAKLKEQGTMNKEQGISKEGEKGKKEKGEVKRQVHNKSAVRNRSGMICSGEQTVWLYVVQNIDTVAIEAIIDSLEQNETGSLHLSPEGIRFFSEMPPGDFFFEMRSEEDWTYIERTGYKNKLFIIGGGHCALAFSKLMRTLDFYIAVIEDRQELHTVLQNDAADEILQVESYEEIEKLIPDGYHHYVVIMTVGYRTDEIALKALLHKQLKFLGLLGSQKKIEEMFAVLRSEGIQDEALQRIHAPVGIFIKSETPEEIAVSIAAQIIKTKNMNRVSGL